MNLAAIIRSRLQKLPHFQIAILRNIVNCNNALQNWNNPGKYTTIHNQLHGISKPLWNSNLTLTPTSLSVVPSCGMKVKGIPKLRCKDCYYIRKEGRLHVNCDTHPRHKQMQMLIKKKKTWLLSHACMSKERPY